MATTVSQLIIQALIDLRFVPAGATVGTDIQTECFLRVNQLLASLSAEGAMVFNQVEQTFNLTAGTVAYTLGSGGTFPTTGGLRAQKVTSWRASYNGLLTSGGPALSMAEFGALAKQPLGEVAAVPDYLGADTSYPLINVRVTPPPSATPGTLELAYWTPITAFATVGDSINFPPGYERMLHYALAIDLHPRYGKPGAIDPALLNDAQVSKAAIVQQNTMMLTPQAAQQQQQ
jgi:hypothetical protein